MNPRPLLLLILDGFGVAPPSSSNAIAQANTPVWDKLWSSYPHTLLDTTGEAVGLPKGVMGNSEVGHLTLGAGRVVPQALMRINQHFEKQDFAWPTKAANSASGGSHPKGVLESSLEGNPKDMPQVVHVLGMISDGGVHSHLSHICKVLEGLQACGRQVVLHAITDGRDTPPKTALRFLERLEQQVPSLTVGTVMGRFYAMDRDRRWERIEAAYRALTEPPAEAQAAHSAREAIEQAYEQEVTDEFIKPRAIAGVPRIQPEDGVVFCHFRADRVRELSMALSTTASAATSAATGEPPPFATPIKVAAQRFVTFTSFHKDFEFPVLFPQEVPASTLGEVVAQRGHAQLRVAETEKYAHVTYFFNGGREAPFDKEQRILVPSPREVATYDQKPEMSVRAVTQQIQQALERGAPGASSGQGHKGSSPYTLIVANFANGDMVGHTGNLSAAIQAVESMDHCLGLLLTAAQKAGVSLLVTADHGNCEEMRTHSGGTLTQHSKNPVPLVFVEAEDMRQANVLGEAAPPQEGLPQEQAGLLQEQADLPQRQVGAQGQSRLRGCELREGTLADVAPTCLDFWGWEAPAAMTGQSLFAKPL